ncbi:dysbindin isoform X1 [Scyliorhinus canicula]|uniref:dysbindin isoform X1 n=2 Tax=Scyliorhinus canicula TaxID=7830 RepID=UPI0018F7878A|nr:dysbindin isoform X1 [Scyliorhinus canicula]
MSTQGPASKRTPSATDHTSRLLDTDQTPQMKFRDRQRFFEDVFQPDADFYLTAAHLQIEHQRPPIGSVSSMEVNVDMLEQVDLMDMSDQEALDVFLNSSMDGCEGSTLPDEQFYNSEITIKVPNSAEIKSRMSSTSSNSTNPTSLELDGDETPIVQSDEEDVQVDTALLTPNKDKDTDTQSGNES